MSFEDRYLQTQIGTIVRINQRAATVDTGDVHSWRVGFALLRHVLGLTSDPRQEGVGATLTTRKHHVSELCAMYAISRKTGYKWIERCRAPARSLSGDTVT